MKVFTHTMHGFDRIHFATAMISKEYNSMFSLQYLYVTEKMIASTNGHALFTSENDGLLEPGYYYVTKRLKRKVVIFKVDDVKSRFPDIDAFIRKNNTGLGDFVTTCGNDGDMGSSVLFAKITRKLPQDKGINFAILRSCCNHVDKFAISEIPVVVLKGNGVTAYIMTLTLDV